MLARRNQTYSPPGGVSPNAQSYAKMLHDLSKRYPFLVNLEKELSKYKRACRIRMINIPPSPDNGHEFKTPQELNEYLGQLQVSIPPDPRCRVFVVENLTLEYISVFGHHFNIDPTIFAKQVGTSKGANGSLNWNTSPKLFGQRDTQRSFTLPYIELREFAQHIGGRRLTDNRAGRRIATSEIYYRTENFCHTGLVKHLISCWCKESTHKNCWDALILLDPEVNEFLEGHDEAGSRFDVRNLPNEPYRTNCGDFAPWPDAVDGMAFGEPWPQHSNPYDVVSYHLGTPWVSEADTSVADIPALIVKGCVLSHMMALVEYMNSVIGDLQYRVRRIPCSIGDIASESILVELLNWNCRLSEYAGYVEDTLEELRVELNKGAGEGPSDYSSMVDDDFRRVYQKLTKMRTRTQELHSFASNLQDVLDQKLAFNELWSRKEGRAVIAVTFAGILFLPLALIAEIFGMRQNFGPGESQFWVYWIVAIPSCFLVVTASWLFVRYARTGAGFDRLLSYS